MVAKLVLVVVLFLTSGCSTKVRKPTPASSTFEMVLTLRTSDEVNELLFQRYLGPFGIPNDEVQRGHVTLGWINHIDPVDIKPLEVHMHRYFDKIKPQHYSFNVDRLGEYLVNRKPGHTPLILHPKNASSFKRLNYFLNQHLKTFKGRKQYTLSVGTEPELFVPHLTVAHEDRVNQLKINRLRIKGSMNRLIRNRPTSFRFNVARIKVKEEKQHS